MLKHISWYDYILYSFSGMGIYYCYVLLKYYRQDLRRLFTGKKNVTTNHLPPKLTASTNEPEVLEQLFSQAMVLSEAVKGAFVENNFQEGTVEELFQTLRKKIAEYPALHATAFRIAIRNLIESEAAKYQLEIKDVKSSIERLWVRGDA